MVIYDDFTYPLVNYSDLMESYSDSMGYEWDIPSGKLSHNYGKSPFSMGKSTINGHFQ